VFSSNSNPGPSSRPGSGGQDSVSQTSYSGGNPEGTTISNNSSVVDNTHQITITDNQSRITNNDVVTDMNRRMENLNASSSSSSLDSSPIRGIPASFNKYNVLDQLEQLDQTSSVPRPDSPTGSTDSSETITPIRSKTQKAAIDRLSANNK
jgi:hypothetical protein